MQWYAMTISTWSEIFPSFEGEYTLQNAKHVLFNTVLFNLDCTTVSKWQNVVIYKLFWIAEICKYFFLFWVLFKNCIQNYPIISREYSGKKLLVTTEDILHILHFNFQIFEPCVLQILKFLIFSCDEVVVESNGESDR